MCKQFFLGDAADACIIFVHRDEGDIVQFAEDANLRELGDAGKKDETEFCFAEFQRTEEVAHDVSQSILLLLFVCHVKHGCIIFVDEHNYLFPCFLVCCIDQFCQSVVGINLRLGDTPSFLFHFQDETEVSLQLVLFHVLASAQVKMQHWIFCPFLLQLFDGKSFEQVSLSLKIVFEGRY